MHQTKARKRERKHAHIKYSSRTSLRLLLFPLPARQPSARHNPFAPHRSASRRAGDSSGSQRGREGGRRKKRAGKPREAGATTATLPHSSPRLPPRGIPVDSRHRPHPPRVAAARRAGPICSAAPPPPQVRFWLFPSPPPCRLPRGRASLSVGPGMARAPDLLRGRGGVGGC